MHDTVEEIKKKIDIIEFLTPYVALKKAGRNFKGLCPFHQEKTPSFVVSPERQIWRCFGSCNDGGDVIKFVMKYENLTFFEAVQDLAQKAGIKIQKTAIEDQAWKKKERFISMNQLAAEYFNYILFHTSFGKKPLEYLKERSINDKIAQKFLLGYAPSSWDSLYKFLTKKKFTKEELYEGGLLVKSERGSYYDRFRGRLMFPIKDARGVIIGFSGRSLDPKEKASKYINTPETPLYHKRESLFGIDLAKDAIKKENTIYLVEGEFDVLSPYAHGIENIVATKGTAVTREQLSLIKRYTSQLVLALDADSAGEEAVRKTVDASEGLDLEIEVVGIDFAKDPDEAVRTDADRFKKLLKAKQPVYDFLIEKIKKKYPENDPYAKKKIGEEIVPLIEKIQNSIVQSYYIKKLALELVVSEQSIEVMIRKTRARKKQQTVSIQIQKTKEDRETNIQKYILSLLFQNKSPYTLADGLFRVISIDDFTIPAYSKISKMFLDSKDKLKEHYSLEEFTSLLPKELLPVLDETYLYASVDLDFQEENLEKLSYEMKKISLKKQIGHVLQIDDSEKKSEEALKKLTTELNAVEKKLATV